MNEQLDYLIVYAQRQVQPYRNPTGDWLGIHYLAAFLNENGISTRSFGGYAHEVPAMLEKTIEQFGVKVIGLSCDYENKELVEEFCRYIKERWSLPVIVGGPQAFALDEDFFRRSGADVVICGEGELTSLEVVSALLDGGEWHRAHGITYLDGNRLIRTEPRELIMNLDALPFPNAAYALGTLFRPNLASFLTGRGCPFSCSFCYEGGNTRGVRWRSVDNVMKEVEEVLNARPDLHYIMFTDDTFTVDLKRVREFCSALKELRNKHDFTWFCEGHVRTLCKNLDILKEMVEAGMSCLQIGIESGHDDILRLYNKQITTGMIETVVSAAFASGLDSLWGNFILGGAEETPERIEGNIRFAEHLFELGPGMLNLDVVYYWPLPGTAITMEPKRYGMTIIDPESKSSNCDYPVVEYPCLSREDFCNWRSIFMERIEKKVYELLYVVPAQRIWHLLRSQSNAQNFTVWLKVLSQHEHFKKFFCLTECGAAHCLHDFPSFQWNKIHPLRTFHPEQFTQDHRLVVEGDMLSPEDTNLLVWASGKNTLAELAELVDMSIPECIARLQLLESKRLVVFSEF